MITLRPAKAEDAPALGKILQDWLDETPWMPNLHVLEETQGFLANLIAMQAVTVGESAQGQGFLARQDDQISALYVSKTARGRGLGSHLLQAAQSQQSELRLWTFQANAGAIAFYVVHGFRPGRTTDGDNEEGLPDLQMTWTAKGALAP